MCFASASLNAPAKHYDDPGVRICSLNGSKIGGPDNEKYAEGSPGSSVEVEAKEAESANSFSVEVEAKCGGMLTLYGPTLHFSRLPLLMT